MNHFYFKIRYIKEEKSTAAFEFISKICIQCLCFGKRPSLILQKIWLPPGLAGYIIMTEITYREFKNN